MDIVDVVVHVRPSLSVAAQRSLEQRVRELEGVIAPRFNRADGHLLLVAYDPAQLQTTQLLQQVRSAGYDASLVGM